MHRLLKSLGQNFLRNAHDADRIAHSWGDLYEHDVLEVGPGDGRLTRCLLKLAKRVIAVEIDKRWVDHLWRTYEGHPGFVLRHNDVTKIRWEQEVERPFILFGNLPYHLSSAIMFGAVDYVRRWHENPEMPRLEGMVVMLQKEVADRASSLPGSSEYGILPTFLQLYGTVQTVMRLPSGAFIPPPKVDSAVIRVDFNKPAPDLKNWQLFDTMVRASYAGRRKMLRNTLPAIRPPLPAGFMDTGLDLSRRPQTLSPLEWVELTNRITELGSWSKKQVVSKRARNPLYNTKLDPEGEEDFAQEHDQNDQEG